MDRNIFNMTIFDLMTTKRDDEDVSAHVKAWFHDWCTSNLSQFEWVKISTGEGAYRIGLLVPHDEDQLLMVTRWQRAFDVPNDPHDIGPFTENEMRQSGAPVRVDNGMGATIRK